MLFIDALTKSADQITEKYDRDSVFRKNSIYMMVSGMITITVTITVTMVGYIIGRITDNVYVFLVTLVLAVLQFIFFVRIVGGKLEKANNLYQEKAAKKKSKQHKDFLATIETNLSENGIDIIDNKNIKFNTVSINYKNSETGKPIMGILQKNGKFDYIEQPVLTISAPEKRIPLKTQKTNTSNKC